MSSMPNTTSIMSLPNNFQSDGAQAQPPVNKSNELYNSNVQMQTSEVPHNDIPLKTEKLTSDQATKVNFMPESENEIYYIPNSTEKTVSSSSLFGLDTPITIDDIKMPVIIALLFVLFQLPSFRTSFKSVFLFGFNEDDTLNQSGIYMLGILFGLVYFGIMKLINNAL